MTLNDGQKVTQVTRENKMDRKNEVPPSSITVCAQGVYSVFGYIRCGDSVGGSVVFPN